MRVTILGLRSGLLQGVRIDRLAFAVAEKTFFMTFLYDLVETFCFAEISFAFHKPFCDAWTRASRQLQILWHHLRFSGRKCETELLYIKYLFCRTHHLHTVVLIVDCCRHL